MKVELAKQFQSLSGTVKLKNGTRMVFKNYKRPDGKSETRAYFVHDSAYKRKNEPSDAELAARELFARRRAFVTELINNKGISSKEAWDIAKRKITNDPASTLKGGK